MACEYCHQEISHDPRCPKYDAGKPKRYCVICGHGIYSGDEYIENYCKENAHLDCFDTMQDLASWLGYDVKAEE